MHNAKQTDYWAVRLHAVGRAQSRYLFLLAIAGLFYYALDARVSDIREYPNALRLPVVGIEVSALTIWASGPTVLGFLLLAVLGTLPALEAASSGMKRSAGYDVQSEGLPEELATDFNILDAVVYTTPRTPQPLRRVLSFAYPAVLTLFWLEAAVLLTVLLARPSGDLFPHIQYPMWQRISAAVFRALGVIFTLAPSVRLLTFWRRRLAH